MILLQKFWNLLIVVKIVVRGTQCKVSIEQLELNLLPILFIRLSFL